MALSGQLKRIAGPAYLANSATDVYTPPASTIYTVIHQIHLANVTSSAVTYSLYIGATGGSTGGTQIAGGVSIPANTTTDLWFPKGLKMLSTDFLVGIASAATTITVTIVGEQVVV